MAFTRHINSYHHPSIAMNLLSQKQETISYLEGFYEYDEAKPIPIRQNESYYYLNPKTGKKSK